MNESRQKQLYAFFQSMEQMGESIETLINSRNKEYRNKLHQELLIMFRYLNKTQALYYCYAVYAYKYGYEALTIEKADKIRRMVWQFYGGGI